MSNKLACEGCNAALTSPEVSHSMLIVLQKVDAGRGYSWMQCEQGQAYNGATFQHWHCGPSHMRQGVRECITNHYQESSLVAVPTSQVRLHHTVLGAGLRCKVCQSALQRMAYRYCLTHATPVNSVPDDSQNELGEWCCSLAHAQQSALATLASIPE